MKFSKVSYGIVFVIALLLCIANVWGYPITILDEAKNAEAAREMWLNNAFLPTFNDELRTDKPPLHYFFMQLGYSLFGANPLGARFFGVLMGAGLITYIYSFLLRFSTVNIARIATFILLSSFFWIQEFHLAVPDPYLITLLCSAWMLFYTSYKTNKSRYLWLFYVFVGFATLAKGPVAIGLSGLIVLIFLICKKEFSLKGIMQYRPILGGLLVLFIAVPWFIWIHNQTHGVYTEGFFLKHNIQRFSNEMEGHGGLFIITWGFVLLGLFPFGLFIPQGIIHGFKFHRRNDLTLFSLIISLVIIGFFSISSTRLPNYTLPAMPFLAILVASYFDELRTYRSLKTWWNLVSMVLISLITIAIPVAVYILFKHNLIKHFQLTFTLLFLLVAIVGLIYSWKAYYKRMIRHFILGIGTTWIIIGSMIFYIIYPNLASIEPVQQANKLMQTDSMVVYKNYDPAFNFNYGRVFPKFSNAEEMIHFIKENPEYLVLTKDRSIREDKKILKTFDVIFKEPSVFENYQTMILRYKN